MNKEQRKEQLKNLIKEANIKKSAQDLNISGEEFANNIFDELLDNLKIEGLDD